jgi:carbon storage regulator
MLYLSRKIGEAIVINNSIELTVIEVRGKTVKLGFNFPPEATVLRKEIYDKIMAENMAAAGATDNDFSPDDFEMPEWDALPPPTEKK